MNHSKASKISLKTRWAVCLFVMLVVTACGSEQNQPATTAANSPLEKVADIELPGNTERFDYQSLDAKTGRLFIAHLGASSIVVFDVRANKVVGEIKDISDVHGVLAVSETGRLYASATGSHEVAVIDATSLKVLARVPAGNYPDGLAYDPTEQRLYVSDEGGNAEPVIDTTSNQLLTKIELGGEAGNTQYDPTTGHIFVDVQSLNQLSEIDPKTNQVVNRYPLAGCQNDHGLQLDPAQRLAFIACDGNAKLLVADMGQGMALLATYSTGSSPDVLALDSQKSVLYVACESGIVSVFDTSRAKLQKLGEGLVAPSAHSIAVDPQTHQLYLPLQEVNGKPTLRVMRYPGA